LHAGVVVPLNNKTDDSKLALFQPNDILKAMGPTAAQQ
jgi:hypothetical protein